MVTGRQSIDHPGASPGSGVPRRTQLELQRGVARFDRGRSISSTSMIIPSSLSGRRRHSPQPGLAELRLAEGDVAAAAAAIRRVVDEA
jgi:hypothetical protein